MNRPYHSLSLIFLFAFSFLTVSCNDGGQTGVEDSTDTVVPDITCVKEVKKPCCLFDFEFVVHAKMSYYDFDKVGNLSRFFDTIIKRHGTMIGRIWNEDPDHDVRLCIAQIDNYRKGEMTTYPDSLVVDCMKRLGFECAHRSWREMGADLAFSEWFLMCAAFYAPDITCLVHAQTPDHRAGFYNFGLNYNRTSFLAYMFVKRKKGFEVIRVSCDGMGLTDVYQLEDGNHNKYYLFSNNSFADDFWQELYMANGDSTGRVLQIDKFPLGEGYKHDKVYFDPEETVWQECDWKAHPIADSPKIKLILGGKKSRYEVIQ